MLVTGRRPALQRRHHGASSSNAAADYLIGPQSQPAGHAAPIVKQLRERPAECLRGTSEHGHLSFANPRRPRAETRRHQVWPRTAWTGAHASTAHARSEGAPLAGTCDGRQDRDRTASSAVRHPTRATSASTSRARPLSAVQLADGRRARPIGRSKTSAARWPCSTSCFDRGSRANSRRPRPVRKLSTHAAQHSPSTCCDPHDQTSPSGRKRKRSTGGTDEFARTILGQHALALGPSRQRP